MENLELKDGMFVTPPSEKSLKYCDYLTYGEKYQVSNVKDSSFTIMLSDGNILFCNKIRCAHINSKNWKICE